MPPLFLSVLPSAAPTGRTVIVSGTAGSTRWLTIGWIEENAGFAARHVGWREVSRTIRMRPATGATRAVLIVRQRAD